MNIYLNFYFFFHFSLYNLRRYKRTVTSKPINLYVELLLVTDKTIFQDHQVYAQSDNIDLIFSNMKIYFSHFFNGVYSLFIYYANAG